MRGVIHQEVHIDLAVARFLGMNFDCSNRQFRTLRMTCSPAPSETFGIICTSEGESLVNFSSYQRHSSLQLKQEIFVISSRAIAHPNNLLFHKVSALGDPPRHPSTFRNKNDPCDQNQLSGGLNDKGCFFTVLVQITHPFRFGAMNLNKKRK